MVKRSELASRPRGEDDEAFDPLAVENVGVTLAVELLEQSIHQVPPTSAFPGAGVYALYYLGGHPAYQSLVSLDGGHCKYPVYIGKAAGESSKQGFSPKVSGKRKLLQRIRKHASSIEQAANLVLSDFRCRYLVLNDAYISLAESVMIRVFRPPWNGMSLGSNPVGRNRMAGEPALWDSLHPGRGGRPAGSSRRAAEAERLILDRVSELQNEPEDPKLQKMFRRVMRFV